MSLFEQDASPFPPGGFPPQPPPEDPARRRTRIAIAVGAILLGVAILAGIVVSVLPAPYVIERPGPTFDVLADIEIDGEELPLISIPGETTYATEGSLRMTTVTLLGSPERLPAWIDVVAAWFDPAVAVLPVEAVFPPGVTLEQTSEQSQLEMQNSQREAIAAALNELDIPIDGEVVVAEVVEGSPVTGILQEGDVIVSFAGQDVEDVSELREAIGESGAGVEAPIVYLRDGEELVSDVTPILAEDNATVVLSIYVSGDYDFPFTVDIQLQNVGGPSAGLVFALGILDKLTDGALTGGEDIAGTGTISADGTVGAIGGIGQKLYGARDAGAQWFLAPQDNCGEVVGNVPDGLTVFAVATLDDAIAALDAIRVDDTADVPTCDSVVG